MARLEWLRVDFIFTSCSTNRNYFYYLLFLSGFRKRSMFGSGERAITVRWHLEFRVSLGLRSGAEMGIYLQLYFGGGKVKVAHVRLPRIGSRSWSRVLAVSLQVTWVINPAVGCQYLPPGLQLPPQPFRGLLPISLLVNRGTMDVNSLRKTVTRQRRGCDLNRGLLRLT